MIYPEAKAIADELIDVLQPYCKKIEVAGSVRRKKEEVKDIEICLVPDNANKLFNMLGKYLLDLNPKFSYIKNGTRYKQFVYRGCQVDMFIAREDNWGLIYLMRTGSAEFSAKMLARWKKVTGGGYSKEGYLYNANNEIFYTPEEEDMFRLCKMEFVEPELRS